MVSLGDETEEKKRKRRISNRESARRSRIKREKHMQDLIIEKSVLERKLNEDEQKYFAVRQSHFLVELENTELRDEAVKLKEYLNYMHHIIASNYKETDNCYSVNYDQPVVNYPWRVYGPGQQISASAMFV